MASLNFVKSSDSAHWSASAPLPDGEFIASVLRTFGCVSVRCSVVRGEFVERVDFETFRTVNAAKCRAHMVFSRFVSLRLGLV
jgi:lysophospholipid acyltransferase (LPLAT)-like uncharacterized protein